MTRTLLARQLRKQAERNAAHEPHAAGGGDAAGVSAAAAAAAHQSIKPAPAE